MKKGRNSGGKEEDGLRLWHSVVQGIKAYSLPKNRVEQPAPRPVRKAAISIKASSGAIPSPRAVLPAGTGFDRATSTKLKRGQLPLEGRLDLHGMTQAEAFGALGRFIHSGAARGKRTVLVITGKGGVKSGGVLKRMLPLWLEDPALGQYVVAAVPAQPKDGGSGAFYIRLRKPKK